MAKKITAAPLKKAAPKKAIKKVAIKKSKVNIENFITIEIDSLEKYISEVNKFKEKNQLVWFRGHASNSFVLEPSIYRSPHEPKDEKFLLQKFKSKAVPYLKSIPNGEDKKQYWEWLFLMQHYKVPTRLLDWSESALIGLAFAVMFRNHKDPSVVDTGAHIWCINPLELNSEHVNIPTDYVPDITDNSDAQTSLRADIPSGNNHKNFPLAVVGPQNNPRIVSQKGVFTIFPITHKFKYDDCFKKSVGIKLKISTDKAVFKILDELYLLGISETMVFPELDSISKEIVYELSKTKKNV